MKFLLAFLMAGSTAPISLSAQAESEAANWWSYVAEVKAADEARLAEKADLAARLAKQAEAMANAQAHDHVHNTDTVTSNVSYVEPECVTGCDSTPAPVAVTPAQPAPVAPAPAPAPAPVSCEDAANADIAQWLAGTGIGNPTLVFSNTQNQGSTQAYYLVGRYEIVSDGCPSTSVLAHELSHYVADVRTGSWPAHIAEAANFCLGLDAATGVCTQGWINGAEAVPGVEHLAHCIGNHFIGDSTYTRCNDQNLHARAGAIIG